MGDLFSPLAQNLHGGPNAFVSPTAHVSTLNPSAARDRKADVELTKTAWGTEIEIQTKGVPAGFTWGVWLERPDGNRVPAGSFTSADTKVMKLHFNAGLPVDRATAIGMTEFTSKKEVRVLISDAHRKA